MRKIDTPSLYQRGFTIVELLIVVVVVAILAGLVIVGYRGVTSNAGNVAAQSDLETAAAEIQRAYLKDGSYPSNTTNLPKSPGTDYTAFTTNLNTFCLEATSSSGSVYNITERTQVTEGECPPPPIAMQTITSGTCTTKRMLGFDARDNHTYWVQKLADGKCWMLTNLAYAGGGTATYGDTKSISNGNADAARVYVTPRYFTPPGVNPPVLPAAPSTNADGTDAAAFGYMYNWCAAMGAQLSTAACANALTPAPDTSVSICPSGWRLPTGTTTTGELTALNNAVNSGSTTTSQGLVSNWLGQKAGRWSAGFLSAGAAFYWSSTQSTAANAWYITFSSASVTPSQANIKGYGLSVRCVAN